MGIQVSASTVELRRRLRAVRGLGRDPKCVVHHGEGQDGAGGVAGGFGEEGGREGGKDWVGACADVEHAG